MGIPTRLAKAARFKKAWENYLSYLDKYDERPDKVGQGEAKPDQIQLYVHPFSQDFEATFWLAAKGTAARWTSYSAKVGNRAATTTQEGDIIITASSFKPARIVIKENVLSSGQRKTSARTKLPYLNYGGKSGSLPFGANAGSDDELTAYNAIANSFKVGGVLPANLRLSRIKEKA